jgi:hypothetical protein
MDDDGKCSGSSHDQEQEAAELAGALLVPAHVARAHAIRGGTADALALKYKVSWPTANWRMQLSGGPTIAARRKQGKTH